MFLICDPRYSWKSAVYEGKFGNIEMNRLRSFARGKTTGVIGQEKNFKSVGEFSQSIYHVTRKLILKRKHIATARLQQRQQCHLQLFPLDCFP